MGVVCPPGQRASNHAVGEYCIFRRLTRQCHRSMRRLSCVHWLSLVFPLLLSSSWTTFALDSRRELSQFNHEVWLTEHGLPQNTVHAIAQTGDGYIWIGTEEGLARFDGVKRPEEGRVGTG